MPRIAIFISTLAVLGIVMPIKGQASEPFGSMELVSLTDQIPKAGYARSFQGSGYELADGEYKSFKNWYKSESASLYVEAWSRLSSNLELNWGISSGEMGEKYTIDPSLKLGLRYVHNLNASSKMVFTGHRSFGGAFREKTCRADYGEVGGGERVVNCRLAATELAPEDTIEYILKDETIDWALGLNIQFRF